MHEEHDAMIDAQIQELDLCPHGLPYEQICARCDDNRLEQEQREWEDRQWRRRLLELPRE